MKFIIGIARVSGASSGDSGRGQCCVRRGFSLRYSHIPRAQTRRSGNIHGLLHAVHYIVSNFHDFLDLLK